eukprot:TRINITY_DN2330_c0_g4_i1.p1 TRINITY_DN2330_c0_g4~~TRINITY_DN2330_c0_g4_i1.p1  ORF type:complete len:348 (+),score=55.17 TRINITY_DN2330_c0_g4_i1:209-1252(+)
MKMFAIVMVILLAFHACFVHSATLVGDFLNSKFPQYQGIVQFDLETLEDINVWNFRANYLTACYRQDQELYYVLNWESNNFYVYSLDITTGKIGKSVNIPVHKNFMIFGWQCDTEYGLISAFTNNTSGFLYIYSTSYATGSTRLLISYPSPVQMSHFTGSVMIDTVTHSLYFMNFTKADPKTGSEWGSIVFIPLNGSSASVYDYFAYQSSFQTVVYNAPTNIFVGMNVSIVWDSNSEVLPFEYKRTEKGVIRTTGANFKLYTNYVSFCGETSTFTNIGSPQQVHEGYYTWAVNAILTEGETLINLKGPNKGSTQIDYFYPNGKQLLTEKVLRPGNMEPLSFIQLIEN